MNSLPVRKEVQDPILISETPLSACITDLRPYA